MTASASSSSCCFGANAVSAKAVGAKAEDNVAGGEELSFSLVPLTGRLGLVRDASDAAYVVDKATIRKQKLPHGNWLIAQDELGWVAFENVDGEIEGEQSCLSAEDSLERL